jgi:thioredoxin reductase
MNRSEYPVVVIGAGPVGLAAAAHVLARNLEPLVLERGSQVGASMAAWGHVRLFSPWRYAVDKAAVALLQAEGWTTPDPESYPTGADLVRAYLQPLAATPEMRSRIRLETEVIAVTRDGFDKMKTPGRELAPFVVSVRDAKGREGRQTTILARAVIDASGTWTHPNPLGGSGRYAAGERELANRIAYGIPDVLGAARPRYAGKRVLVVGSGHSAFNVLLDLVDLADADADVEPRTTITWAIRRPGERVDNLFGGGINDALPARGALGERVHRLVEAGRLRLIAGLRITGIERTGEGVVVRGPDTVLAPVDEIIAVTGFRPDLDLLSELRLALDSAVESPVALAPLIDPNLHSCGSVPPHGAEELRHPDPDVYIVGMKSYGRAPTFLMLTGYEQVRSVAAAIAGDWEAARDVQLVLPETGVCSTRVLSDRGVACCGPAADAASDRESGCCGGVEPVTTASGGGGCCESAAPKVVQLTVAARGSCC